MTTRRHVGGEVRATDSTGDGAHTVTLRAIVPNVVDDYGSVWMADAFDKTLAERLPVLAWSHNWSEPIGVGLSFTTSPDGPLVVCRFDDFAAVPRAGQAYHQVSADPPTIRDCSVGFSDVQRRDPTDEELVRWPGVREVIESARMDELSLVLAGAVPGAAVVGVRMARDDSPVSREEAAAIVARVATGEWTLTEALNALDGLDPVAEGDDDAGTDTGEGDAETDTGDTEGEDTGETGTGGMEGEPGSEDGDALTAEVDSLMDEITDALATIDN